MNKSAETPIVSPQDTSSLSSADLEKIIKYIDAKNNELKLSIIKYVDEKFRSIESSGKELVLSNQTKKDIQHEVLQIIKKDVAPQFSKQLKQAVAFVDYKTEDGEELIAKHRMNNVSVDKKRIGYGTLGENMNKSASGGEKANPLHNALFYFDGDD
jgi:hypothetical protein